VDKKRPLYELANNSNSPRPSKIGWLLILQGFAMLLVVVGHAWLTRFDDTSYPEVSSVIRIIYHFHMSLFFCISGFLFWQTKLSANKSWLEIIRDKAYRLLIPYISFTLLTLLLKTALPGLMKRQAELSFEYIAKAIIFPDSNPLGELWFVAALFILFIPGKIYTLLSKRLSISAAAICLVIAINWNINPEIDYFGISKSIFHFPAFFFGILLARHKFIDRLPPKWWAIPVCAIIILLFETLGQSAKIHLNVISMGWIFSCFWLSKLAEKWAPNIFSSFRDHTFQIFLLGIFFQIAIRVIFKQLNTAYYVFFGASIFLGLYGSVAISLCLRRWAPRWIKPMFGL